MCESSSKTDNMKMHLNFFLKDESVESLFENRFNFGKGEKGMIVPKTNKFYGLSSKELSKNDEKIKSNQMGTNETSQSDWDNFKISKISKTDSDLEIRKCKYCT